VGERHWYRGELETWQGGVSNGMRLSRQTSLTPLFLAIGLPAEGIGILIAVDAIPDTFATVLNTTGDLAAAALVASFPENGHDQRRKVPQPFA
jgi:Na+/H+-dicarboxylate symporter